MVKAIRKVLRRQEPALPPRHRVVRSRPAVRTHPWFEQRAQRVLELGQYR